MRRQTERVVSEVERLMTLGETFMDASCMVISWQVVDYLDDLFGDEGLVRAERHDLQGAVQEMLRAVYATEKES